MSLIVPSVNPPQFLSKNDKTYVYLSHYKFFNN